MTSIGANLRVFGHYSQGGRKYMEDAFVVAYQQAEDGKDLEFAFFGVYDGHGGKEAAQYAKKHLLDNIIGFKYFWSDEDSDVLKAIRDGFIATHLAMWKEVDKWPKTSSGLPSTAGTTASVAFLRKGKLYTGHVGDSKIVIGYKTEGLDFWQPKHLTKDHKPDSPVEKKRIYDSGGLVMNKAGVERVVWKRPKNGHLGPVRRSTDFEKIPFLAVARSLGDLWSYDYFHKEFVVSPEPDVNVMLLDPNRDCCIILATDGLWNMVPVWDAVRLVRATEIENREMAEKCGISLKYGWSLNNPAKVLVDSALERWNTHQFRADNTSVVIVMVDPFNVENDETCHEPLVFRTSFSHGLMETDVFWYQRKDPLDVPSLLKNQLSLKDSIEDIIQEFSNNNNEDSENFSLTGTGFLDCKETSRSSTASPLQSCSNILPKVGSHSFKALLRKGCETQGVENSIRPFPRWSRSASGRTSLSKLVSWSKTVSRRRMSDPFPRRTCNNPVVSEADCSRRANSSQSSEENSVCSTYDKCFSNCDNSCSTEQGTSASLSSATCSAGSPEEQTIPVCEHDHSYQIFDCSKCNKFSSIKGGVKRRFSSSEHPHSEVTRCTDYDNENETIYPWKRKPSSYRLSITALKALDDFKQKRQMFSVKV